MPSPDQNSGQTSLFEMKGGPENSSAWACTIYSLVPFLGILFAPIAIILWIAGIFRLRGNSIDSKAGNSLLGILSAVLILVAQTGLWWLLYLIPKMDSR